MAPKGGGGWNQRPRSIGAETILLTKEDERMKAELNILRDEELVQMAHEGSSTAEEYLIQKYKTLARNKAQTYFIVGGDNEDVIQEGMIGIFKAIRDYDPNGTASFRTFAELCVTRQILSAIEGANRKKHQILNDALSLNDEGDSEEQEGSPLIERLAAGEDMNPETAMLAEDLVERLEAEGVKVFSPMEHNVWKCLLQGMSYREIARELEKSPKSIDNAIQRIKKKLTLYLKG